VEEGSRVEAGNDFAAPAKQKETDEEQGYIEDAEAKLGWVGTRSGRRRRG